MNDFEFNPYKIEVKTGMECPMSRGWAKNLLLKMSPKKDQYVDMPDQFKCQALYGAARTMKMKVKQRKIREGVYRVWRVR